MTSSNFKQWLQDQINIWQYNAQVEEKEGDYKSYGISMARVNAYHSALVEFERCEV